MSSRWGALARVSRGLPEYLRAPFDEATLRSFVCTALERREARFLDRVRAALEPNGDRLYGKLFAHAGCTVGELEQMVGRDGLDASLLRLAEAGVMLTVEEFKRERPIERGSLRLLPDEWDFATAPSATGAFAARTSASRGSATGVRYNFRLIYEHAATEWWLNRAHQLEHLPLVLWLPPLPSVAGTQYALINLKWGRLPLDWFSPIDPSADSIPRADRIASRVMRWLLHGLGGALPAPEYVPFEAVEVVARRVAQLGRCVLRCYASSAVRVARAAVRADLRLDGCVMLCGGEALTASRRREIARSGALALSRYSSTEAGLLGGSCAERPEADELHLYSHRIAMIEWEGRLLVTGLSPHAPLQLINVDIGDRGAIEAAECACQLGQLGLSQRVSGLHAERKFTAEGMNLSATQLERAIEQVVSARGGGVDDWQVRLDVQPDGIERVELTIAPWLGRFDAQQVEAQLLTLIAQQGTGGALTAEIWRRAGTIRIVRGTPQSSLAGKHHPFRRSAALPAQPRERLQRDQPDRDR
jgi:hypothetical protein